MKLLWLLKTVAAAENLGGKVRRQTYAGNFCGKLRPKTYAENFCGKLRRGVKSVRHTIYDRTKEDVEISAPGKSLHLSKS